MKRRAAGSSAKAHLFSASALLGLSACGRVLQPTLNFNVINAPGTSDFTRCKGGIEARFEVRDQTIFESPVVIPARVHREAVTRPVDTTDDEPVVLEATCYGAGGAETGYTCIETLSRYSGSLLFPV